MLKYKIIHGILGTNSLLYKLKKVPTSLFPYPYYLALVYTMYWYQLFLGRFPRQV